MTDPQEPSRDGETTGARAGTEPDAPAADAAAGVDDATAPAVETPAGETAPAETPVAETPVAETPAAEPSEPAAVSSVADDPVADGPVAEGTAPTSGETAAPPRPGRKALLIGGGIGALGLVVAVLTVLAYAWPGFLAGPGSPDDMTARAVAAFAAKDGAAVADITCKGPDGTPTSELPPQALEIIQGAEASGPATLLVDTQAQLPMTLTLAAQGQSRSVPTVLLFGVTDGEWCLAGLSQQQPQ